MKPGVTQGQTRCLREMASRVPLQSHLTGGANVQQQVEKGAEMATEIIPGAWKVEACDVRNEQCKLNCQSSAGIT